MLLVCHGVPAPNPSICRQIFVMERMSEGAAAGPSERDTAMVMGHSVKQWHDWYDLKVHFRLAQNDVNSMQDWRRSLFGVAHPSVVPRLCTQIFSQTQNQCSISSQPLQINQHQGGSKSTATNGSVTYAQSATQNSKSAATNGITA